MLEEFMFGVARSISNIRTKFIFGAATFAAVVAGLILAFYEVQGWDMPAPLAIAIAVILFLMFFVALVAICYEVIIGTKKYFDERATSASWVSKEEPGLLDYEADGLRATERFTKELLNLTKNNSKFTIKLNRYTAEFQSLQNNGKIIKGVEKQKKANAVAKHIDRNAIYIEKRADLFDAIVKDIARNYSGLISATVINTKEDRVVAQKLLSSLISYEQSTTTATNGLIRYIDSVRNLGNKNISRTINIASVRLGKGLDCLLQAFKNNLQGSIRIREKLEKKIRTS